MASFDPYHKWLGIPADEQPPNHYRLLGLPQFESDPDAIESAAERHVIFLRSFQLGPNAELAEGLLNEVSEARVCLLDKESKAGYDQQLREALEPAPEEDLPSVAAEEVTPVAWTPTIQKPSRRSRAQKPFWQQPWAIPVGAAGIVVVLLLLMWLSSAGQQPQLAEQQTAPATAKVDQEPKVPNDQEPKVPNDQDAKVPDDQDAKVPNDQDAKVPDKAVDEEREAELKRLAEEKTEQERLAAAEKLASEKLAAGKSAAERAVAESVVTIKGHSDYVTSVAWSPDGKRIASGSKDKTIKVWDAETGQQISLIKGHFGSVNSVAWSPDGKRLVSGSGEYRQPGEIKIWDAKTGQETLAVKGQSDRVVQVEFSPDGKQVLSDGDADSLKVWDAKTGEETLALNGHSQEILSVAFSPDGKQIVSGSRDATAKVWDAKTGERLLILKGHSHYVMSVAFSSNSKRIVTGSLDQTVKVWDAESGQAIRTLKGHSSYIFDVAFSPDGNRIVSGSHDRTIKVWDANTGQHIRTLKGHTACVNSVRFSPDGKRIISGSEDNTIKIWNLEAEGLAPAQPGAKSLPESLQQGLVAYYPFNGNAQDESGNGNHGTVHGASLAPDRYGDARSAYHFLRGADAIYAKAGKNLYPHSRNIVTYTLWFKLNSLIESHFLSVYPSRNTKDGPNRFFVAATDRNFSMVNGDIGLPHFTTTQFPLHTWQQLVVEYNYLNATAKAWHNGTLLGKTLLTVPPEPPLPQSLRIGSLGGNSKNPDLLIDDIRIYNRALSDAEVKQLYTFEQMSAATSGQHPVTQTEPATPVTTVGIFAAQQAREYQAAWAKHLGLEVELVNSIGMKFVLIPPGDFMMATLDPTTPGGILGSDQFTVAKNIPKPFYFGIHEVTQSQYRQITNQSPAKFVGPNNPVNMVNWDDADNYCRKLSAVPVEGKNNRKYRLPTEAEWEYAARAGQQSDIAPAKTVEEYGQYAWYQENAGGTTHPVGTREPNHWGLFDTQGNLAEWCQGKVNRGSRFGTPPGRISMRGRPRLGGSERYSHKGFRLVLDIPERILRRAAQKKKPASPSTVTKQAKPDLKQGLVAYYPFNGNVNDESGNNNHGEVQGATLINDRHGDPRALGFSKDGHRVVISANDAIRKIAATNRTVSCWIFPVDQRGTHRYLITRDGRTARQWNILVSDETPDKVFIHSGGGQVHVPPDGWKGDRSALQVRKKVWSHLVFAADDLVERIYINGDQVAAFPRSQWNTVPQGQPLLFGRSGSANQYFGGLDEVRFYNRALSAAEVKALYEFEKP